MGYLYMVLSVRLVCLILTWVQFSSYFSQFLYAILGSVVKFCQFCLIGIQNVLLTHTAWFLTVLFLTLPEGSLSKCNGGDPLHVVPTAPEQVLWVWRSVKETYIYCTAFHHCPRRWPWSLFKLNQLHLELVEYIIIKPLNAHVSWTPLRKKEQLEFCYVSVKPTGSKWHGDSSMVFLAPLGVVGGVNHIFQQEFF